MSSSIPPAILERQEEEASQTYGSNNLNEQGAHPNPVSSTLGQSSNTNSLIYPPEGEGSQSTKGSRPTRSNRASAYSLGDFRNGTSEFQRDVAAEIMVSHLANIQEEKIWVIGDDDDEGVVLKRSKGNYTCAPSQLGDRPGGFFDAIREMNVRVSHINKSFDKTITLTPEQVAMTVNTRVIKIMLSANSLPYIETREGLRIQVISDYSYLPRCQKHQFAAFVGDPGVLVVWDDDPQKIVGRVQRLESEVMGAIWRTHGDELNEKNEPATGTSEMDDDDPESARESKPRRLLLNQPCITALTLAIAFTALGAGYRQVAIEIAVDRKFIRLAFLAVFVPQMWLALVRNPSQVRQLYSTD